MLEGCTTIHEWPDACEEWAGGAEPGVEVGVPVEVARARETVELDVVELELLAVVVPFVLAPPFTKLATGGPGKT